MTENKIQYIDTTITRGRTEVNLEVVDAEDILIATLPLEIDMIADTRGDVTVPTNAKIENHTDKPLKVTDIEIYTPTVDWVMLPPDSDMETEDDGGVNRILEIYLCGDLMSSNNKQNTGRANYYTDIELTQENWKIPANGDLPLDMEANISEWLYLTAREKQNACSFIFTIAFDE